MIERILLQIKEQKIRNEFEEMLGSHSLHESVRRKLKSFTFTTRSDFYTSAKLQGGHESTLIEVDAIDIKENQIGLLALPTSKENGNTVWQPNTFIKNHDGMFFIMVQGTMNTISTAEGFSIAIPTEEYLLYRIQKGVPVIWTQDYNAMISNGAVPKAA